MLSVCESYMHDVCWGVKRGDVVLQNIKMKSWIQQPSLARPLLPVTDQQTLSWNIRETGFGSGDDNQVLSIVENQHITSCQSVLFPQTLKILLNQSRLTTSATCATELTKPWTQMVVDKLIFHCNTGWMEKGKGGENNNKHRVRLGGSSNNTSTDFPTRSH